MEMKTKAVTVLGLFAVIALPLHAAQPTPGVGAMQDGPQKAYNSSYKQVKKVNPQLKQRPMKRKLKKKPTVQDLELAPGQYTPPVITDPESGYICCATRDYSYEQNIKISASFSVSGTGLPGHRVEVRAELKNGDSRSLIKARGVTVDADGHWKIRHFNATSSDMNTNSGFIEINATQIFPATRVRQPDGEAHAQPVFLRFHTPDRHGRGAASSGG